MMNQDGRFQMDHYARREPFCSFLPGIGGELGIPLWCYYVNRGQCVSSFGVEDKDHAIMEFFPAHQAYQYTGRVGWRTFVRVNGAMTEPFADATREHSLWVGMNDLTLRESNPAHGFSTEICYFTLPEERAAALVRRVVFQNTGDLPLNMELLDGMPALLPYGLNLFAEKEMTQTAKAWMQAEDNLTDMPCFRLRASLADTSDVQEVAGVNFATARTEDGKALRAFVDPRHVFAYDTSLQSPVGFASAPYEEWLEQPEVTQNILPCCFFARKVRLEPGERCSHTVLVGQAASKALARRVCDRVAEPGALRAKHTRAVEMTRQLTAAIDTKTADPVFDGYCRQTYLDNLLRGGVPVRLPGGKLLPLYSRKHGDPERDYNAFRMRPEYYSQGNGNFRDVNQNRRCDVLFEPAVGDGNIRMFYGLLQADGYNPLVVEYVQFTLADPAALLGQISPESRADAEKLLSAAFTPGQLRMAAEDWAFAPGQTAEGFFAQAMREAESTVSASFGEGYWSDHWTYSLDQIEAYLSVYPEREEALLYGEPSYPWFQSPATVLPRAERYDVTDRGVRQYRFLRKREISGSALCGPDGQPLTATLMEKLLTLCAVKTATLDPYGMGVEMEGGKPGWYDALNGLPGLLGSSMPETLELRRVLGYVADALKRCPRPVSVLREVAELMRLMAQVLTDTQPLWSANEAIPDVWNALCDAKEAYRAALERGVSGEKATLAPGALSAYIGLWTAYCQRGIDKAMALGDGLCPTYFAYDVTEYTRDEAGLHSTAFALRRMPDFLEGQVRFLRLCDTDGARRALYEAVRASRLYDQPLRMYKVNAALGEASYEIGRAHAFTPGWLENESVWLHMEYKYLLELLRGRLYDEFLADFHAAAVPFLDPEIYGRSTLENSSFIASSANPDPSVRGKGFVARLSGSTAEFLSIWQIMLLGERLFTLRDGLLTLTLQPLLPGCLTDGIDHVEATLLGKTRVIYHIWPGMQYVPGQYRIARAQVRWADQRVDAYPEALVQGEAARRVRDGEALEIELWLEA